jgi:hypothetical protein
LTIDVGLAVREYKPDAKPSVPRHTTYAPYCMTTVRWFIRQMA